MFNQKKKYLKANKPNRIKMARCPYCGRRLAETERYCWHCEQDVSKVRDKEEKPKIDLKAKKTLLDDIKEAIRWVKGKVKR